MGCSRCGSESHLEYGSDGQAYCSQCIFYGTNSQCTRCRMYLPKMEMQNHAGQLYCPYCLADIRSENRSAESYGERGKREGYLKEEQCDRCGRTLSLAYFYNGRKLCETCIEQEKSKWGGVGSEKPTMHMMRVGKDRGLPSRILSGIMERILAFFGIKTRLKESEIVAAPRQRVKGEGEHERHYRNKGEELHHFKGTDKPTLHGKDESRPGKRKEKKDEDEGYA